MKAYYLTTEKIYNDIQENEEYYFEHLHEFYNSVGLKWLTSQYNARLNVEAKSIEHSLMYPDECADWCNADSMYCLLELDIPEGNYLMINQEAESGLINNHFITKDEKQWLAVEDVPDHDFSLRKQTWLTLFDPNFQIDESWGSNNKIPYFHKVNKEWIKNVNIFRGKHLSKWVGPDKIDPKTYPPLSGYGDDIKIGDKFIEEKNTNRIMTLLGWEWDEEYELMHYHYRNDVPDEEDDKDAIWSSAANTHGGDRIFRKI